MTGGQTHGARATVYHFTSCRHPACREANRVYRLNGRRRQGVKPNASAPDRPVRRVTTREAADRIGVSYRQVNHWITSGYVKLDEVDDVEPGSGNVLWLTRDDVERVADIGKLRKYGVELKAIVKLSPVQRCRLVAALDDIHDDTEVPA